jgi:hypothetical protein
MDEDLGAGNVDEGATGEAHHNRGHHDGSGLYTNANADSCRFDQRESEENEEDSFLRFSLMLSKLDSKRNASNSMMNADSDHEIHEGPDSLLHSECNAFKDGMETKREKQNQWGNIDSAQENLFFNRLPVDHCGILILNLVATIFMAINCNHRPI